MFSRNLLRIVAAVVLAVFLTALPAAAQGRFFGPLAGRGPVAWLADLLENIWSEEGGSIDPNGRPVTSGEPREPITISAPEGVSIDPNGAPRPEAGSSGPNGL